MHLLTCELACIAHISLHAHASSPTVKLPREVLIMLLFKGILLGGGVYNERMET
jgi:hypothetical protein